MYNMFISVFHANWRREEEAENLVWNELIRRHFAELYKMIYLTKIIKCLQIKDISHQPSRKTLEYVQNPQIVVKLEIEYYRL